MADKLLTQAELRDLTGAGTKPKMREVLDANRVPYFIRADGWPVVTWDAINAQFGGKNSKPRQDTLSTDGFNIQAAHG